MKLKYLFSAIFASVLFVGCNDEELGRLDTISLADSYLSIPNAGGTAVLTIDATDTWEFVTDDNWPDVIKRNKDNTIKSQTPSWLSADKMSGAAGESKVTFSAAAFQGGRELELKIKVGNNSQFVRVRQGSMTAVTVSCKEANESPEGKNVRVSGVCTAIENTLYGNWYLTDKTGSVYIYGTLDKKGAEKNFASLGIELGDVVTVEGPVGSYKGSPQLVKVTVISIKKSLIKIVNPSATVSKDGGEVSVKVAYKGNGVFPSVPEDCDWVKYVGMSYVKGVPTKIEPSPADTAVVKFTVAPNSDDARKCEVKLASYKGKDSSDGTFTINQDSGLLLFTLPFEESFKNGKGSFTIENVLLPTGSTYVWSEDTKYGCMKASSFVNKTNLESESWLVSPIIDLAGKSAKLSFKHALNFVNKDKPEDHISVWAKSYGSEWKELTGYTYPKGKDWNFVESGDIDLKDYLGTKFQLAFKYVGSKTAAPTWEVKEVVIK